MIKKKKGVILIVDDEEIVRLAIEMVLESQGYKVLSVGDGLKAIEVLRQEDVDLVITDMRMPRADGLEVLREAKLKRPAPKVIVITGFASEDPAIALGEGADDFIYKAFKREDILKSVRRLLSKDGNCEGITGGPAAEKNE